MNENESIEVFHTWRNILRNSSWKISFECQPLELLGLILHRQNKNFVPTKWRLHGVFSLQQYYFSSGPAVICSPDLYIFEKILRELEQGA